ncbi:MAG: trigger factor [Microgenomates bacterium 39_7]|nr:MAG: trigger factor [Microgenomates bacterium 39_7]
MANKKKNNQKKPTPNPKTNSFQIKVSRLKDNTIKIEAKIPQQEIKKEYDQALEKLQKTTEIKGFRKGRAPKERVEKVVGQNEIYQQAINQLLPKVYQKAIEENQLKPIIAPQAKLVSAKEGEDWLVEFTTCELPEIDLNDYQEKIKKTFAKEAIWTPEKDKKDKKNPPDESLKKAEKFQKIIDILVKSVEVVLPEVLITNEVNQKLANLIEKTEKMGLSLEQYLATLGKTIDSIKDEYRQESEKNWKLELALNKIADKEKIVVSEQDIEEALRKIENKKEKAQLSNQRYMLSSMIRRQKTLEFLQSL